MFPLVSSIFNHGPLLFKYFVNKDRLREEELANTTPKKGRGSNRRSCTITVGYQNPMHAHRAWSQYVELHNIRYAISCRIIINVPPWFGFHDVPPHSDCKIIYMGRWRLSEPHKIESDVSVTCHLPVIARSFTWAKWGLDRWWIIWATEMKSDVYWSWLSTTCYLPLIARVIHLGWWWITWTHTN